MTRTILLLTFSLIACESNPNSGSRLPQSKAIVGDSLETVQSYFVNDIVSDVVPTEIIRAKPITGPKIVFIEKQFMLSVNKADLMEALKNDLQQVDNEDKSKYGIAINYVDSSENLKFEFIWSKPEIYDGITWSEAEKLDPRDLTEIILKETVCSLIRNGKVEIVQATGKESEYFIEWVHSDYGGEVNGVFTTSTKTLVWICPPFIID